MTNNNSYPSRPAAFFVQRTSDKAKLFIAEISLSSRPLRPVATVKMKSDDDVTRLVSSLNKAAWTGDRSEWESIASKLPDAVTLSCNQAIASMPSANSLALGLEGTPMVVLTTSFVALSDHDDLETMASEAYGLALQALIDNYRDSEGVVYCRFRLLSGEPGMVTEEQKLLWSNSEGAKPADSLTFGPNSMSEILADPRWMTNKVRMYWVSVVSGSQDDIDTGEYESEAEWVVEYFDEQIPNDPEPDDPAEDECFVLGDWNPWPLTSRTRFVLWQSLICLNNDLQQGLVDWSGESDGSEQFKDNSFMQEFPSMVKVEPRSWWESLQKSCTRLIEAMRTGEQWNPRTPGEEVLIFVACGEDRLGEAEFQIHENSILLEQFEALPVGTKDKYDDDEDENSGADPDFDWREVPNALAGDEDIAILWDENLKGVESPDDMRNQFIGMGDYRAEAWYKPFDRYQHSDGFPSTLF